MKTPEHGLQGPSAGLAIALAMLSAATGRPVRRRVAVTGELSVHGNVNPVGGVAENLSAALRQGRKLVVIPAENASQLRRLEELAMKLEIHPVRTLKEAWSWCWSRRRTVRSTTEDVAAERGTRDEP